jgi:chemotaxis protein methyltransferase CheR
MNPAPDAVRAASGVTAMSQHDDHLSSRDFNRLSSLVYDVAGIRLTPEKKTMLEMRVKRRLRALNCSSYSAYCDRILRLDRTDEEILQFIDVVTTNKTDFFREPGHFEFLVNTCLGEWCARCGPRRPMLVWSAACSSGEEPYTLAMLMSDYRMATPGFNFQILATDISTAVLAKAVRGIYPAAAVEPVPLALRRRYLLRSRDRASDEVRVVAEMRRLIDFRRLNFMDSDYGLAQRADVIFCRNALIYFDRPTQEAILAKLTRCLQPHGYLFVGHSESLHDMNLPLRPAGPAVYRRLDRGC